MSKKQPLANAGQIIERFGGIRPMAAKIDTPVTTVQGWKKRDVIPGTRRAQILSAAAAHNIDLSDLADASASNENNSGSVKPSAKKSSSSQKTNKAKSKSKTSSKVASKPVGQKSKPASADQATSASVPLVSASNTDSAEKSDNKKSGGQKDNEHERLLAELQATSEKAMVSSAWIATGLILLALLAGALLFWPYFKDSQKKLDAQSQKLVTLEQEVQSAQDADVVSDAAEASDTDGKISKDFMNAAIPENLQEKMDQIQKQARNISITVDQLSEKAQDISEKRLGESAEAIQSRLDSLEAQIKEKGAAVASVASVPGDDVKAAAILVAFSQFRSSLEREEPFEEDLALLQKMVGDDNPELQEKLTQLSQHADGGVLTTSGLASELKKMTADIVVSSLKGEDVSLKEKAKARFGSILQVEKDGEILSGTKTQTTVAKAQEYVEQGKIEDGIVALEGLDGDAAQQVAPFIAKAKATLLADQVKAMLNQNILSGNGMEMPNLSLDGLSVDGLPAKAGDIKKTIEKSVSSLGGKKVVKDEESGLSILPKSSTGFKGLLDKKD